MPVEDANGLLVRQAGQVSLGQGRFDLGEDIRCQCFTTKLPVSDSLSRVRQEVGLVRLFGRVSKRTTDGINKWSERGIDVVENGK